jgi:hypothetical protein
MENKQEKIKQLIENVINSNINISFNIDNSGATYKLLSGVDRDSNNPIIATNKVIDYVVSYVKTFDNNFDINSIYTFARIFDWGDNTQFLFVDIEGQIYHCDIDNGWDPRVKKIANSFEDIIGNFNHNNFVTKDHHFKYIKPIVRIGELIDTERVIEFIADSDFAFTIEDYEKEFNKAIIANKVNISESKLKPIEINEHKIQNCVLTINNVDFQININITKLFDLNFIFQINNILNEIMCNMTFHIIQEEDWDELFGLVFLTNQEYELFYKNRLIADNKENAI